MSVQIAVTNDFDTCFELRRVVFIVEQNVPIDEEIDDIDDTAVHLLAQDETGPLGTARIFFDGKIAKIGRVCVVSAARSRGIGAGLIRKALEISAAIDDVEQAKLGAQTQAVGFYEALGFKAVGSVYLDAGIEHMDMVQSLK